MSKEYRNKDIFELVEPNGIYECNYGKYSEIFWVGKRFNNYNEFLDKQYTGQLYGVDSLPKNYKKITLEKAVKKGLITFERFMLMNSYDKTETIKIMLKGKGIISTLNFIADAKLDISEKEIKDILKK